MLQFVRQIARKSTGWALAGIMLTALTMPADAYSKRVQRSCLADYKSLCPQYRPESPQLRACMEGKSNEISWGCIEALIDSGEVDKKARHPSLRRS
jgi:hypothetical protein